MANYTRAEAEFAAKEFQKRYGLETIVIDHCQAGCNYSFFGIWKEDNCILTIENRERYTNLLELAYLIVQVDEDLNQDEPLKMSEITQPVWGELR